MLMLLSSPHRIGPHNRYSATDNLSGISVATVEDSVLRTEMAGLESLEEDDPKCILFYKPMGWLGQIRPHRRDESWSPSL